MNFDELTFNVAEVFPTTTSSQRAKSARTVQFLLSVRPLVAIERAAHGIAAGSPTEAEDYNLALALMLGATKEAADAFAEADRCGDFETALTSDVLSSMTGERADALSAAYRRLKEDCDKKRPSLLRDVVGPMRDRVGFHWSRERIEAVLVDLQDVRYQFRQGGSSRRETQFPFLADLVDRLRQSVMPDSSGADGLKTRLTQMCHDLVIISEHLFAFSVLNSAGHH